jgi:hypothetical protein
MGGARLARIESASRLFEQLERQRLVGLEQLLRFVELEQLER